MKTFFIGLVLFSFAINVQSQTSEPTLEECLVWLEQNCNQKYYHKGFGFASLRFESDANANKSKFITIYNSSSDGIEFDFSEVEFEFIIEESNFKVSNYANKYREVPVLKVIVTGKNREKVIRKLNSSSYVASNGNIVDKGTKYTDFAVIYLRFFDTWENKNDEYFNFKNRDEVKNMFEKVFKRIVELKPTEEKKSIDNEWFKN